MWLICDFVSIVIVKLPPFCVRTCTSGDLLISSFGTHIIKTQFKVQQSTRESACKSGKRDWHFKAAVALSSRPKSYSEPWDSPGYYRYSTVSYWFFWYTYVATRSDKNLNISLILFCWLGACCVLHNQPDAKWPRNSSRFKWRAITLNELKWRRWWLSRRRGRRRRF